MTPQVLLVFMTRFEECKPMLSGITHYARSHHPWDAFLDDQARAEVDPEWLRRRQVAGRDQPPYHRRPGAGVFATEDSARRPE
jgi:hypothetical protein